LRFPPLAGLLWDAEKREDQRPKNRQRDHDCKQALLAIIIGSAGAKARRTFHRASPMSVAGPPCCNSATSLRPSEWTPAGFEPITGRTIRSSTGLVALLLFLLLLAIFFMSLASDGTSSSVKDDLSLLSMLRRHAGRGIVTLFELREQTLVHPNELKSLTNKGFV
jgi:hypothetical protein